MSNVTIALYSVDWCPHCRTMKPVWNQVKSENTAPWVSFIEIDGDENETPGIDGYPTIRASVSGKIYQYRGGANYYSLRQWVDSLW